MKRPRVRLWGIWGAILWIVIGSVVGMSIVFFKYQLGVDSWALTLAAIMMGWAAWQNRSVAYSSWEQLEELKIQRREMVKPRLSLNPGRFHGYHVDLPEELYLHNTGGSVRELKIDINTEPAGSFKSLSLYCPTLDRGHQILLPIEKALGDTYFANGTITASMRFQDTDGTEGLQVMSIDFGSLKVEDRRLIRQQASLE